MKLPKPNLGPTGPYATKEDRMIAKECGISVKRLRLDRANDDRAGVSGAGIAGKVITLGISPAQGRKNLRLARKKAGAANLKFEPVTLRRAAR